MWLKTTSLILLDSAVSVQWDAQIRVRVPLENNKTCCADPPGAYYGMAQGWTSPQVQVQTVLNLSPFKITSSQFWNNDPFLH